MRRFADHVEEVAAGSLLVVMAILAFANIVVRYLTRYSFAFTEEIEVAALVWITMFGAAIGFRKALHLGFTSLRARFSQPVRRALATLSGAVALATMATLAWAGWRQIQSQIALRTTSEALGIPEWTYTAALPVGGALIVLRLIQAIGGEIRRA